MPTVADQAVNILNAKEDEPLLAAEAAKPSSDPAYWAKKSCSKCYGKGIAGTVRTLTNKNWTVSEITCACAKRQFKKWRDKWISEYMAKKNYEEPNTSVHDPVLTDNIRR